MKRPTLTRDGSRRVKALLSCGILLGTGAVGTTALWSTTPTSTSGTFTTGFIDLQLNTASNNTDPAVNSFTFTFPNTLLPGDRTAFVLNLNNRGSVPFTVAATGFGDAVVGQYTTLKAATSTGTQVTTNGATCAGGDSGSASAVALGTAPVAVVSWPTSIPAGPTGSRRICLEVLLETTAPATAAGQTGSVTVTFTATSP